MPFRPLFALALAMAMAVALVACGDDDDTTASAPVTTAAASATTVRNPDGYGALPTSGSTGGAASLALADINGRQVLVNGDGMAVYLFTKDTGSTSACTGGCAQAWPPVMAQGEPAVADDLDEDDLGTITRDDGSTQVTWYGHPLYTYASDTTPGQATGQGQGGVWFLVDAEGNAVQ